MRKAFIFLAFLACCSQVYGQDVDITDDLITPDIANSSQVPITNGATEELDDDENSTQTINTENNDDGEETNFIVGGQRAGRRLHPWMVSVQIYYYGYWYHICGGALIQSHKVVVAAHCMWRWRLYYYYYYYGYYRRFRFRVGLGWYDLRLGRANPYSQTIFVKKVDFHPEYRRGRVGKIYYPNDIAIITLSKCAVLNKFVSTIPLAVKGTFAYQRCTLTGWGYTGRGGDSQYILQKTDVTVISNRLCRNFWRVARLSVSKRQVCTLDWPYKLSSACYGDAGSPLVCNGKLVGVISWGLSVCNGCFPDVSSRITAYRAWIRKIEHDY